MFRDHSSVPVPFCLDFWVWVCLPDHYGNEPRIVYLFTNPRTGWHAYHRPKIHLLERWQRSSQSRTTYSSETPSNHHLLQLTRVTPPPPLPIRFWRHPAKGEPRSRGLPCYVMVRKDPTCSPTIDRPQVFLSLFSCLLTSPPFHVSAHSYIVLPSLTRSPLSGATPLARLSIIFTLLQCWIKLFYLCSHALIFFQSKCTPF